MALIKSVRGFTPKIGENCFLADNATIIGDVEMGKDCSIWFNAVLRGDADIIAAFLRESHKDLVLCAPAKIKPVIEAALDRFKAGGPEFPLEAHFFGDFEEFFVGGEDIGIHFEIVRFIFFGEHGNPAHEIFEHGFVVQIADRTARRIEKRGADERDTLNEHGHSADDDAGFIPGDDDFVLPVVFDAVPAGGLGETALRVTLTECLVFGIAGGFKNFHRIPPL